MRAYLKKLIRRHRKAIPARTAPLDDLDARLQDWAAALDLLRAEADEATTKLRLRVIACAKQATTAHARATEQREALEPGTHGSRQARAAIHEELDRLGELVTSAGLDRKRQ